jgi:cytoskeletal protein CcmA (bactofilin family)
MKASEAVMVFRDIIRPPHNDAVVCMGLAKGDGMFTRTSESRLVGTETRKASGADSSSPQVIETEASERSVIGNDLKILGQGLKITGRGVLQIDGELDSDVQAMEVVVGEKGKVTGMVAGQQVTVQGEVAGAICAKSVKLQASSNVEGDVHHMSLAVEKGARFEGRSRHASSEADLDAVMDKSGVR